MLVVEGGMKVGESREEGFCRTNWIVGINPTAARLR